MYNKKNILYCCAYGSSRSKRLSEITNKIGKYNADYCGYLNYAERAIWEIRKPIDYVVILDKDYEKFHTLEKNFILHYFQDDTYTDEQWEEKEREIMEKIENKV